MISTFKFDHKLKHMYEGKRVINGCSRQKQNKKNHMVYNDHFYWLFHLHNICTHMAWFMISTFLEAYYRNLQRDKRIIGIKIIWYFSQCSSDSRVDLNGISKVLFDFKLFVNSCHPFLSILIWMYIFSSFI